MAGSSLPVGKVLGIALIVLGAGLIFWGYQLSGSVAAQLTETVSGSMPDDVMVRYIGGAVCAVVGAVLALRG
jgi:drug/metabolite transporter (DMT)-like permease